MDLAQIVFRVLAVLSLCGVSLLTYIICNPKD